MKAHWTAFLATTLLLSGCAGTGKPKTEPVAEKVAEKVAEDVFSVAVEQFKLTDAKAQQREGAGGGRVVVLQDPNGKAETTIQLSKGDYEITVYALAPSYDEDAFYLTVGGNAQERRWPETPGELMPTVEPVRFTQAADGPCTVVLSFAEPNVELDRVQLKRVP